MKNCPKCGYAMHDDAVLCLNCGASVEKRIAVNARPAIQLKTNRGMLKTVLLSALTFGIYGIVVMSDVSSDINQIAGRYDGKKTMHYCLMAFLFSWLTFGIAPIVWHHRISARIGNELKRRGISYSFGAGSYWLWDVLGILLVVGPLVYLHKLLKAMNLLAEDYNQKG